VKSGLPARWRRGNIRRFAAMKTGHTPSRSNPEYWQEVSIPWFTLADVWQLRDGRRVYLGDTSNRISELGLANSAAELLPPGTVVLSRTASVGFSGVMPIAMATSQDFWNWICGPDLLPEYLNYQFKAIAPALRAMNMGSTHQTIYQRDAASIEILVPPFEEQRAIADYLDRETARIETLIDEQKRLMEMLNERRDAVIVEATIRGVSPSAHLIKSGVEWLGDIPQGWSVKAIRRHGTLVTGSTPPTDDLNNYDEEANERPWVRPQDLSSKTEASAWLTADGWRHLRPIPAGSVLVGCIAYSLGSVGYLPTTATTNQQITSIISAEDGRYLYYVMRAAKGELWAASQINRVPILNNQRLGAIRIPVPPLEEQGRIAAYLDSQTAKIDSLIAETEKFIALSRERRVALIAAAVAGQIDVRSEVA
jgi:type I restriction enzyme, S subunit